MLSQPVVLFSSELASALGLETPQASESSASESNNLPRPPPEKGVLKKHDLTTYAHAPKRVHPCPAC